MIRRIFVEKKAGSDAAALRIKNDIANVLKINAEMRVFIRYDIENVGEEDFDRALGTVFSEPPVDNVFLDKLPAGIGEVFGVELLPGQYDQRADSAAQCMQLLTLKERPFIRCADIYAVKVAGGQLQKIKDFLINPVEARECSLAAYATLREDYPPPPPPAVECGFCRLQGEELAAFHRRRGFAMSLKDLAFVQEYFRKQGRDPFEAELKVVDTYWSDHCRHTTFNTELKKVEAMDAQSAAAFGRYKTLFNELYKGRKDKYPCLMDVATIAARALKRQGLLPLLDESEEINACSIRVKIEAGGKPEDWLVMFKNETHNHPTEIEPYGGAATCLGGAIRDPLSGRAYVYQAMRISGAGDIKAPLSECLKGKLPQRVISRGAAAGFSSYGNQIGLATGLVHEAYHPHYVAKRLETGFVVGAAPAAAVVRQQPAAGDLVYLIGGRTGRDGCGGATGSSKVHNADSLISCGAEVQKGNPLTERKIQRLFRNPDVTRLIKRCNDFGAGGVSVAIGELSDGLIVDLDALPRKYEGLTATELAISESQERMAVVIAPASETALKELCEAENLEATKVAVVTDDSRLVMLRNGLKVVDLKREFLNTNGVRQSADATLSYGGCDFKLDGEEQKLLENGEISALVLKTMADYNVCSQKGLGEMFDSTIGAGSVLMPFGGKTQLTPAIAMAAKLPALDGTEAATVAAYGFDPFLAEQSCYLGGLYAVVASIVKAVAAGADFDTVHLTMQEFFPKCGNDPTRWGKPLAALLGALDAQMGLEKAAIGGKDSMSGSFEQLDVPPTIICFALGMTEAGRIISNVLSEKSDVYRYRLRRDEAGVPDLKHLREFLVAFNQKTRAGKVDFATVTERGGAAAALIKAALGNELGLEIEGRDLFEPLLGDMLFQGDIQGLEAFGVEKIAEVKNEFAYKVMGVKVKGAEARQAFVSTFESVYPQTAAAAGTAANVDYRAKGVVLSRYKTAMPRVLLPVFPGTNCEYDTARRFQQAGAAADVFVLKNYSAAALEASIDELIKRIGAAQILAFPGGFSGGDEPDGSGKFIATTFFNPRVRQAVETLLQQRDGLILGICNGFQALIKLGLLPFGQIAPLRSNSPTLTFNNISRHVSTVVSLRVASNLSPWLSGAVAGGVYKVAVSHGEGKFLCDEELLRQLASRGQIATQYVGADGNATMLFPDNPNGSAMAVEGITSPDGRIFGKMGHSERIGAHLMKNVEGENDMKIFESGVAYFK